jgi:hypothetical protein
VVRLQLIGLRVLGIAQVVEEVVEMAGVPFQGTR